MRLTRTAPRLAICSLSRSTAENVLVTPCCIVPWNATSCGVVLPATTRIQELVPVTDTTSCTPLKPPTTVGVGVGVRVGEGVGDDGTGGGAATLPPPPRRLNSSRTTMMAIAAAAAIAHCGLRGRWTDRLRSLRVARLSARAGASAAP